MPLDQKPVEEYVTEDLTVGRKGHNARPPWSLLFSRLCDELCQLLELVQWGSLAPVYFGGAVLDVAPELAREAVLREPDGHQRAYRQVALDLPSKAMGGVGQTFLPGHALFR